MVVTLYERVLVCSYGPYCEEIVVRRLPKAPLPILFGDGFSPSAYMPYLHMEDLSPLYPYVYVR